MLGMGPYLVKFGSVVKTTHQDVFAHVFNVNYIVITAAVANNNATARMNNISLRWRNLCATLNEHIQPFSHIIEAVDHQLLAQIELAGQFIGPVASINQQHFRDIR